MLTTCLRTIFILFCTSLLIQCTTENAIAIKTAGHQNTGKLAISSAIISGQLVWKNFIRKNGKGTDRYELYLRLSTADYFIKFCESAVEKATLVKLAGPKPTTESDMTIPPGVKLVIKKHRGEWDICPGDPGYSQSRVGEYITVSKIVNP